MNSKEDSRENVKNVDLLRGESSSGSADLQLHQNYLDKCQVDTPLEIVRLVWKIAHEYREQFELVFDPGAGDGRFSKFGNYIKYTGCELDPRRFYSSSLPPNAEIFLSDAFNADNLGRFDLVIGNPPYVRHHDLDDDWRERIAGWIGSETGVLPSGWSNAYIYFIWLSILASNDNGLLALLVPFDWVARPAAKSLRDYIKARKWSVDIYRLDSDPFPGVLTTACIVIVDKQKNDGQTKYFRVSDHEEIISVDSPTLSSSMPIEYKKAADDLYARRGLSPGDQTVFLLNEQQRINNKLIPYRDVVPAVSSMRHLAEHINVLDGEVFQANFVEKNVPCWLINPEGSISPALRKYLEASKEKCANNATCKKRKIWWKYQLPKIPSILYASGFRTLRPKMLLNEIKAVHVGAVCGIISSSDELARRVVSDFSKIEIKSRVVALSRGFTKIEVNQMNSLLQEYVSKL